MRILLIAYALDSSAGSEPGNGWQWLTNLAKEVEFVTAITTLKNKDRHEKKIIAEELNNVRLIGIPEISIRCLKKTPTLFFYFQYIIWQKSVRKYLLNENLQYDVAHQATMGTFVFGSCLSKLNRPFVLGPAGSTLIKSYDFKYLGLGAKIVEFFRNLILVINFRLNFGARRALTEAGKLIVANTDTYRVINGRRYEHKIVLEPQEGVRENTTYLKNVRIVNPFHILWVGRFLPRKNPIFALKVISKLIKIDPKFHLEFIGNGIMEKKIKRFIKKENLENFVSVSGWISIDELNSKYETAGVLIFTSVRESGGTQLLEALTCGLPVVSLDGTGASTWLKTTGMHFVSSRNCASAIEQIAEEILKISSLEEFERSELQAAIRKDVLNNWSWQKKTKRVLEIYQEIYEQR
jgi:glycosyltransferase involved in cell wall biosynthesis